ncbi:hypothetical protein P2H44_03635 [Albimonas sp. CAU 1670]|uniref:hypothetical protein n=1 Tax=Albimonas sp. CAU 1670 TaxID=3032599 RepID=UPI0023DC726B|nr:hypothetical protein [Albimonas sp. CAU 1670]MDF2231637.1 hypothetical protein [Albimonas sp. CAU 1670]
MVRRALKMLAMTAAMLAVMDLGVAGALSALEASGKGGSILRFFEYGRSVPGKLRAWVEHPDAPGNLFDVAWRASMIARSAESFAAEDPSAPVVRVYGMSFVGNVVSAAARQAPALRVEMHSGPGAPPNFTFAAFLDDRANRRAGDVAVLGVLASSLHGMASFSNRFWSFEQPAPFTYPIFLPDSADGLVRIEPVVETPEEELAILADPAEGAAWRAQVAEVDRLYSREAFVAPALDVSPFFRLVRRSLAQGAIERRKIAAVEEGGEFPVAEILRRMIAEFARVAREDGQTPVVVLIQDQRGRRDLVDMVAPTLEETGVAVVASVEVADPRDPTAFVSDGHFRRRVDDRLGTLFLERLPPGFLDASR